MSYSDAKFYSRNLEPVAFALSFGTSTGVGTASNTLTAVEAGALPKFKRKTQLTAVRFRCTTIPNASSTATIAQIKNGTSIAGTVVLTTLTASGGGQYADGVLTVASCTFAADARPTIDIAGTATVSGAAMGSYDIWFETQELFT